jgi:hypothetical protein
MYEKVVTTNELPEQDGNQYRNFEESFGSRFAGDAAFFTAEDKATIKEHWTKRANAYYHGLQPPQRTKLIRVGTGRLVTAVPLLEEAAILEDALQPWHQQVEEEVARRARVLFITSPGQQAPVEDDIHSGASDEED